MSRRGALVAAVLIALGALVSVGPLASPASACSCAPTPEAQAVDAADAVFVGTLDSRYVEDLTSSAGRAVHTFEVSQVRKGTVLPRQEVVSAASGASCGLELGGLGPFLVIARTTAGDFEPRPGPGQLVTGLCGGTRELTAAEIADLSAAVTPAAGPLAPTPENPKGVDGPVVLLAFATGAGVLGFLMILRRERRKRQRTR